MSFYDDNSHACWLHNKFQFNSNKIHANDAIKIHMDI